MRRIFGFLAILAGVFGALLLLDQPRGAVRPPMRQALQTTPVAYSGWAAGLCMGLCLAWLAGIEWAGLPARVVRLAAHAGPAPRDGDDGRPAGRHRAVFLRADRVMPAEAGLHRGAAAGKQRLHESLAPPLLDGDRAGVASQARSASRRVAADLSRAADRSRPQRPHEQRPLPDHHGSRPARSCAALGAVAADLAERLGADAGLCHHPLPPRAAAVPALRAGDAHRRLVRHHGGDGAHRS